MIYEDLVQTIQLYESDTFSGIVSGITKTEAEYVADLLIDQWVNNNLDGTMIDKYLYQVRIHSGEKQV